MCEFCNWEDLSVQIDEMLDDGRYDWAEDTLTGIKDWIDTQEHCTDGQRDAINNIERALR